MFSHHKCADCHLTLLPEILPVHLPAQPAWIPGPGSFHYGTAEGHSRPAKEQKKTRVRQWCDVNPLNAATMSNMKSTLIKTHRIMCMSAPTSRARLARNNADLELFGSLMPLISLLCLPDSVSTHTWWFCRGMICLGWPVISWLWSRRWGMCLINLPSDL